MTDTRAITPLIASVDRVIALLEHCAAVAECDTDITPLARLEGLLVCIEEARDRLNEILKGEGDG